MFKTKMTRITALSALALLALSACSSTETGNTGAQATGTATASATSSASAPASQVRLTVEGAWIKAATGKMTAAFATITNTGSEAITIQGAQSDAAGMTQLHTTTIDPTTGTSGMAEVEGGFTLDAGQTLELAPGGDHIMLMQMTCSLVAGTTSNITLKTSAGDLTFEAQVRDYSGAQEEYAPGEATSPAAETMEHSHDHSGEEHSHDHSGEEHSSHDHGGDAEAVLPQCA